MRRQDPASIRSALVKRPGKILVLTVLLLPVMLGMVGLTIDGGIMMATHRQAQNAADAAAVAAAWDMLRGRPSTTWTATANTYVKTYENLSSATVTVNNPPTSGYFSTASGSTRYIEAVVTVPIQTMFMQAVGVSSAQQVQARAVAGYEAVSAGEGAIVLDPLAIPGLNVSGGGKLYVNGRVVVNSQGGGVDEKGATVNLGYSGNAASAANNSVVQATDIQVVGGVNTPDNFQPYIAGDPNPLHARALPGPDPLSSLAVPVKGMPGVPAGVTGPAPKGGYPTITGSGTYQPGIYSNISLTNGMTVVFNPGIYFIVPVKSNDGISINGSADVTGNGVMFYLTGNNFDVNTGLPDVNDGESRPPETSGTSTFASLSINGSNIKLQGLKDAMSPYDGMLFFQRRLNTAGANIQGNGLANMMVGTIYAKWANFKIAGSGKYDAQFLVGSMNITGTGNLTILGTGKNRGKANQVYLVE